MRNIILTAAFALISVLNAGKVSAQAAADANVSATITIPQVMEKQSDLEIHTTTKHDGKSRRATVNEEVTPATFTVSGSPCVVYGVIAPESLSVSAVARSLRIRTALSGNNQLSADGTDKLSVFASLFSSEPMLAMNAPKDEGLDVTVVYN